MTMNRNGQPFAGIKKTSKGYKEHTSIYKKEKKEIENKIQLKHHNDRFK